jgi:hypothetical protein
VAASGQPDADPRRSITVLGGRWRPDVIRGDIADLFRRGGPDYVDRILRGAKLSDPPIQFPAKFELVINF